MLNMSYNSICLILYVSKGCIMMKLKSMEALASNSTHIIVADSNICRVYQFTSQQLSYCILYNCHRQFAISLRQLFVVKKRRVISMFKHKIKGIIFPYEL